MAASPSMDLSPSPCSDLLHPPVSSPPVAFDVDLSDPPSSPSSVPKRLRKRLLETPESRSRSPSSLQEIEAKLKEADMRRQQFHEWLVNKARPKVRSPPRSQQPEDLADRLQTKLVAAEQKRQEILAQEQTRLARLEGLRAAARTEVQLRAEREREELESRVESRVQQAETNRQALLEAERQRRALIHERVAQSLLQRSTQEGKDKERVEALRALICQKIAAADEKRENLLRAEKTRAQAVVLQARKVAKAVRGKRELELRNKKELLEARLQRAKRLRAEYLGQKGGCQGACHNNGHKMKKHGDQLCRKLTKCWRQFRRSRKTTLMLAQDFAACNVSYQSISSLPFEELAARITSPATLKTVKALLARIESRFRLPSASGSKVAQIDHLLKRISPPARKTTRAGPRGHGSGSGKGPNQSGRYANRDAAKEQNAVKSKTGSSSQKLLDKSMERYPARVFLCAYMIVSHPEAVFSARGEREASLSEAASKLIPEFETLVATIIDGPPPPSSPPSPDSIDTKRMQSPTARPFTVQLSEFDASWCSYLYQFVAWKVQDAHSLEEDLIRVACQLELSMLQKCNFPSEKSGAESSHDSQAIQKQVLEDQQLLRERILHLTGSAGVSRMEAALIDARNQYSEAREKGSPLPSPFASPQKSKILSPPPPPVPSVDLNEAIQVGGGMVNVSKSLFGNFNEAQNKATVGTEDNRKALENESLVNNMLHEPNWNVLESMHGTNKVSSKVNKIQAEIKKTMEDAFWNGVLEGLNRDPPDNKRIIGLLEEMKSELESVVPDAWKQELNECIDVEILSQVLESGSHDYEYFHKLLDYALSIVLRLGAPARDEGAKSSHDLLVEELTESMSKLGERSRSSFTVALVKGLRFVLQQIQVLKSDISAARIQALAPVIQGSAGIEYLQKAFLKRHMISDVQQANVDWVSKLPKTLAWLTEVQQAVQQAEEQLESLRAAYWAAAPDAGAARGIPLSMRTGGKVVVGRSTTAASTESAASNEYRTLKWRSFQTVVRLGIIKLVSSVELATEATVPETMMLNAQRLANAQNEYQRIIVIATGLLLLRQHIAARGVAGAELDHVLKSGQEQLESILQDPNVSIPQIGGLLATLANRSTANPSQDEDLMARILARSLSPEDTVFRFLSTAIQSSLKAIVLLGRGAEGLAIASSALQRVGASCLQDSIVNLGARLETLASISSVVHGRWYAAMVGPEN